MALTPEQQRLMKGGLYKQNNYGFGGSGRGTTNYSTEQPSAPEPRSYNANFGEFARNTGKDVKNFFTTDEFKTAPGERTGGMADLAALGGRKGLDTLLSLSGYQRSLQEEGKRMGQLDPNPIAPENEEPPVDGGGGGVDVSSIFGPLFKALDQQRASANSRYSANVTGITNIYGQLIGARNDDIPTIDAAYKRLQAASESRSKTDINAMSDREASRLSNNNAVLQSMGVEDIGDVSGGVAAEGSQSAINAETMNQATRSGLLDSMSATSQDMARADAASFAFRQGEDIARLQGSREDFLQGVDNQEFGLKSQQAQAQQQAQQAAAANAASAAATAQRAQEAALANDQRSLNAFLETADPMSRIIVRGTQSQYIDPNMAGRMQESYQGFLDNLFELDVPSGQQRWDKVSASQAFRTSPFATQLSTTEKNLVEQAIRESF